MNFTLVTRWTLHKVALSPDKIELNIENSENLETLEILVLDGGKLKLPSLISYHVVSYLGCLSLQKLQMVQP